MGASGMTIHDYIARSVDNGNTPNEELTITIV